MVNGEILVDRKVGFGKGSTVALEARPEGRICALQTHLIRALLRHGRVQMRYESRRALAPRLSFWRSESAYAMPNTGAGAGPASTSCCVMGSTRKLRPSSVREPTGYGRPVRRTRLRRRPLHEPLRACPERSEGAHAFAEPAFRARKYNAGEHCSPAPRAPVAIEIGDLIDT